MRLPSLLAINSSISSFLIAIRFSSLPLAENRVYTILSKPWGRLPAPSHVIHYQIESYNRTPDLARYENKGVMLIQWRRHVLPLTHICRPSVPQTPPGAFGSLDRDRLIDLPQIVRHSFTLFPVHRAEAVAHRVHNAQLHFRLRIYSADDFRKTLRPVHTGLPERLPGSPRWPRKRRGSRHVPRAASPLR